MACFWYTLHKIGNASRQIKDSMILQMVKFEIHGQKWTRADAIIQVCQEAPVCQETLFCQESPLFQDILILKLKSIKTLLSVETQDTLIW